MCCKQIGLLAVDVLLLGQPSEKQVKVRSYFRLETSKFTNIADKVYGKIPRSL